MAENDAVGGPDLDFNLHLAGQCRLGLVGHLPVEPRRLYRRFSAGRRCRIWIMAAVPPGGGDREGILAPRVAAIPAPGAVAVSGAGPVVAGVRVALCRVELGRQRLPLAAGVALAGGRTMALDPHRRHPDERDRLRV